MLAYMLLLEEMDHLEEILKEVHPEETPEEVHPEEEDNQPPQLRRYQYLLLPMYELWEPYPESLKGTDPKQIALWKKYWDTSEPTLESQDSTPQSERLPLPSHSSKEKTSLDGHETWDDGSTD
jgi:hypothetical protein